MVVREGEGGGNKRYKSAGTGVMIVLPVIYCLLNVLAQSSVLNTTQTVQSYNVRRSDHDHVLFYHIIFYKYHLGTLPGKDGDASEL